MSQSNDNADCIDEEKRFKFVDDLSFLEIIYLLSVGLSSYNVRLHVPSDVPTHNQVVSADNLESQKQLDKINAWTVKQKMRLNEKKTKNMIFNFTKKYQFTTKLNVNNVNIEIPKETKLLGTVITEKLTWDRNTEEITKKAYKRMQLLHVAANFTASKKDLKDIYFTFIRSVLEQSAAVWHSSLTNKNRSDLERVQKGAIRVIMGKHYTSYKNSLKVLNIDSLEKRREILCLKFAKKCTLNEKLKNLFPLNKNDHKMKLRKQKKYKILKANTKRYKQSALPYMRRLLNDEDAKKSLFLKNK